MKDLIEKVKVASKANLSPIRSSFSAPRKITPSASSTPSKKIIAIGASTGGTEAIIHVLKSLNTNLPGIVIVQHIPPVFSRMFAERVNNTIPFRVKEAQSGDIVEQGTVLIAPGDKHMKVKKLGGHYRVDVFEGEKVNGHCRGYPEFCVNDEKQCK